MRSSGILMHVSSLPSRYGIGTFGKSAFEFVDFLKKAGVEHWQMLPLTTTGYGDSPYQSFSVYAGNPYFVDLDILCQQGLLTQDELASYATIDDPCFVDYGWLFSWRYEVLHKAFLRFDRENQEFVDFCKDNAFWLDGYALFMVIKKHHGNRSWQEWGEPLRQRIPQALEHFLQQTEQIAFERFVQFLFFTQLVALKQYANQHGIKLIGDIPIYVAEDSVDVWESPELFLLDSQKHLVEMAGCPPDYFSADGQAWGNPIYAWHTMAQDEYAWWVKRTQVTMKLFDMLRIDHFRGFSRYFSYPLGETPKDGSWKQGPGIALFEAIQKKLSDLNIIAEDLGFMDDSVRELLAQTKFPGMKVLQFAFDSREQSDYLPHNYDRNCVVYTGTHDNDTVAGWTASAKSEDVAFAADYLGISSWKEFPFSFIRSAWASVAKLSIVPMQDVLSLNSEARMNTPSTLGGNWKWRMSEDACSDALAEQIRNVTKLYGRLPM